MKRTIFLFGFLLVVIMLTLTTGCSRLFQPSDAEIIQAINDSGILKSPGFQVTSPLAIVERGKQNDDGSWPVKVKMTLIMKGMDGKMSEPKENIAPFIIYKTQDNAGQKIWKAKLG